MREDDIDETAAERADLEPGTTAENSGLDLPTVLYADVEQTPVYLRDEPHSDFKDTLTLEIRPYLTKNGVRMVERWEIYDALFQLAVENPEEMAEIVLDPREKEN